MMLMGHLESHTLLMCNGKSPAVYGSIDGGLLRRISLNVMIINAQVI